MPSDATSAMAAKREMPTQDSDDFEWVNAWAASAGPSAPAVAPEITPPVTAIARPASAAPNEQPAIEPARAGGSQPVASFFDAPSLDRAAEADADAALPVAADVEPLSLPEPATSEMVRSAPLGEEDDATSAPLVPEETTGEQDTAAGASGADDDAVVETVASTPASDEATSSDAGERPAPSAPISFLDFARRAKRSLFSIVARNADPQPEPEALPLEDIPDSFEPVAAGAAFPLAPDLPPDQLERDIAEIEVRRDALYAEWERAQRRADPAARSRTSDYVPILLGTVLGFTLLVVFGAAASFVSLR
jgi:hypothetical protein